MEESKTSGGGGGAQSTDECVNVSQSKSCQSSPTSGQVKASNRPQQQQPQQQGQLQQQLGSSAQHRHLAMAPQHPSALSGGGGGQSPSSHGPWTQSPVWEHARNIAESMEGGGGGGGHPDYNGGRSLDWDMKGSPWEWDGVGSVFPGRRGETTFGSSGSFASGHSSDSASVGVTVVSPSNRGANSKNDDFRDKLPESRNLGPPPSQGSTAMSIEQQRRLVLELGETGGSGERRKSNLLEQGNGARTKVAGSDSMIGLKLGRRTYFEDSGGAAGRGNGPAAVFAVCPPGKKRGLQSPGVQAPRCQVEGCKQDLSLSKDYHRRHKVCELHSKASKVLAAGFEQRFCQQCSRFHVLTEFDEGKRSCRRRLAGHNERRRKPQPESAAIVSTGSSAVFHNEGGSHATSVNGEEDKRGTNGLSEQACFIPMQRTPGSSSTSVDSDEQSGSMGTNFRLNQSKGPWPVLGRSDDSGGLTCQSRVPCGERQPFLSATTTDSLLKFLQTPKRQISGGGVHQVMIEGSGPMGPGLTLASSSGPTSVLSGLEVPSSPSVSGISDSGRALSLLSSQTWASRGGASVPSGAVSTQSSDVTLEQLISDNSRASFSPRGPRSHFHPAAAAPASGASDKSFCLQPHAARDGGLSSMRSESMEHQRSILSGLGMVGSHFESHTMLAVMQGQSEFRGLQGATNSTQRPTIDLMQMPSPQSHGQFADMSVLRPFESPLFDSQQML